MTCRPPAPVRGLLPLALVLFGIGGAACTRVDLAKALDVTDVFSGWYDDGIKDGKNHLVPSITFRLHNKTTSSIRSVQLTVSFWRDGDDGEWDSVLLDGIAGAPLAGGASTEPMTVRPTIGYTIEQPRAELFSHGAFRDATAKIFARRAGTIVLIGEFKLDRRLIPHASSGRP